jgi:CDP-4-dehydro-6-deoxyglucose reductase, E1
LPLNAPTIDTEEILAVLKCFLYQKVTMADEVLAFETEFAQYIGRKHALMVNSGSSANLLMIEALKNPLANKKWKLKLGDEVLVPAVTWSTTITPVINAGLVPVLVDALPNTLNMDPQALQKAIGPKTRAVFVVHILGNSAAMDQIQKIAKTHDLILIEDSCEALGTEFNGKKTGGFGLAASYSFYFSHHITTIEGGMIVTDDDDLAELMRALRAHGWSRHLKNRAQVEAQYSEIDSRFLFVNTGFNLRSTDINAAIGRLQLKKLDEFNRRRVEVAAKFRKIFEKYTDDFILTEPTAGASHTWFGYPFLLNGFWAENRTEFVKRLDQFKIENRPIVAGNLARQPFLKHFPHRISGELTGAEKIMKCGVYIGSHPSTSDQQIDYLEQQLKKIVVKK